MMKNSLFRGLLVFFVLIVLGCEGKPDYNPDEIELEKAAEKYFGKGLKAEDLHITFQEVGRDNTFSRFEYPITFTEDMFISKKRKTMDHLVIQRKFKKGEKFILHGSVKSLWYRGVLEHLFDFDNDSKLRGIKPRESFGAKSVILDSREHKKLWDEYWKEEEKKKNK